MITVHHLGISQSERIVWLMEELGLEYKLVKHVRDPIMAPESIKSVPGNKTGKAPFIEDPDAGVTLSESAAICDYVARKYGGDHLIAGPSDPHFADYMYWFHYANGSFQTAFSLGMFVDLIPGMPDDAMVKQIAHGRLNGALGLLNERLEKNKWLAGDQFSLADIMTVYSATTQRYWGPGVSYKPYPNIVRWLKDCAARPAYQKAREKGDPDMKDLIDEEAPQQGLIATGGTQASHWKK